MSILDKFIHYYYEQIFSTTKKKKTLPNNRLLPISKRSMGKPLMAFNESHFRFCSLSLTENN